MSPFFLGPASLFHSCHFTTYVHQLFMNKIVGDASLSSYFSCVTKSISPVQRDLRLEIARTLLCVLENSCMRECVEEYRDRRRPLGSILFAVDLFLRSPPRSPDFQEVESPPLGSHLSSNFSALPPDLFHRKVRTVALSA